MVMPARTVGLANLERAANGLWSMPASKVREGDRERDKGPRAI